MADRTDKAQREINVQRQLDAMASELRRCGAEVTVEVGAAVAKCPSHPQGNLIMEPDQYGLVDVICTSGRDGGSPFITLWKRQKKRLTSRRKRRATVSASHREQIGRSEHPEKH